jgi:hypothetical protein
LHLSSRVAAATVAALVVTSPAQAASTDPDLRWRTLTTEHFHIHFHQGIEPVADEFAGMVEEVYDRMTEEMAWEPRRRTEVVLIDRTDSANGYARTVPYNAITIFVTAPTEDSTLNLYEDWNEAIFTHELVHVLHMDTNHGIVRAARAVVGRVASTNDISPWWMIEGLATFQETRHTPGGRGRSSWPDMIKRTAVVEDDFPPLGNLDGLQPKPPGGNLRYLFGQDFIDYVARHTGEDVWTRWTHLYGGHVPYLLPSRKAFGTTLLKLYDGWRAETMEHYEQQAEAIRAEGETIGRLVSPPEANCVAPAFSPDGDHLVWSCYDLRTGSAIYLADGEGYAGEVLLQDRGAGYFTWRSDSKAFVYAGQHLVNRFNVWSDIYLHTLGGSTTALTSGARARDPDFSPDGTELLYVTNKAQNNQLEVATVDQRRHRLTEHTDHTQYSTPRYSPDGRSVALSVWRDGRRDLWLYSPRGEPVRRLTADTAIDADPVWSSDGAWLYFSSDRSGVPQIYAIEVATEALFQVTNVVTGAVKPSVHPDGTRMAYQQYSADGWDIRVLDLQPERFLARGTLPALPRWPSPLSEWTGPRRADADTIDASTAWQGDTPAPERSGFRADLSPTLLAQDPPSEVLDSFDAPDLDDVFGEEADYDFSVPVRRYNPLPTLLPRYVLPYVQTTPFRPGPTFDATCLVPGAFCPGLQASLSTSASDALSRYLWSATASYRTDAEAFGGGASFVINRWLPVYSFSVASSAVPSAQLTFVDPAQPVDEDGELLLYATDPPSIYWERRSTAAATVSWPYRLRQTVFARYSLTHRTNLQQLPDTVYEPNLPVRGFLGALSGGWRYSWSQGTAYAISPEDARTVSLVGSLLTPWLGTFRRDEAGNLQPFSQVQLTAELREYVVNPWVPNHVLAMRGGTGLTVGGADILGNYYQLGGSFGDGAFSVTPDESRMLRGYPLGSDFGDLYWLGGLEYRLPLAQVQRGIGTVPAFFRNVSAAAFVDAGNAFNNPTGALGRTATGRELLDAAVADPLVGVGGEVSVRFVLGWAVGITGRLGYGIGLTGDRALQPSAGLLAPAYARIGGSF